MHKNEAIVREISDLKSSKDRKKKLRSLMMKGIDHYNEGVMGSEDSLMYLRNSNNKDASFSYRCQNCNMFFKKSSISNHKKNCSTKKPQRKSGVIEVIPKTFLKKDMSFR